MNWLIYISGWYWGIVFGRLNMKFNSDSTISVALLMWTMTWIWFCIKFIK